MSIKNKTAAQYKTEVAALKNENEKLQSALKDSVIQLRESISLAKSFMQTINNNKAKYDKVVSDLKLFFPEHGYLEEIFFYDNPTAPKYIAKIGKALIRNKINKDNLSPGRLAGTVKRKQTAAEKKKQIHDAIVPLFRTGGEGWQWDNEKITDFINEKINSRTKRPYTRKTLFQMVKLLAAQHRKNPLPIKSGL